MGRVLFISGAKPDLLYNGYSLYDTRQVAPAGYRVATIADFQNLLTFLGGEAIAGGKMKATTKWDAPNTGATNESGLKALPTGRRDELGAFAEKLTKTTLWIKVE
jgi:uncharacterized protein (TIGR02145 family)